MSLFSSARERRLWALTLAVVVAIYSTLGLARTLAGALPEGGLFAALFVLGMLLAGATVVTQGLKTKPGVAQVGVVLGVAAAYLMVLFRMASAVERSHLIEYGVVAVFVHAALTERATQGRRVPIPALLAVLLTALVGVIDESIQALLPVRVFDQQDMLFNALAAAMAVAASVALDWARRRFT